MVKEIFAQPIMQEYEPPSPGSEISLSAYLSFDLVTQIELLFLGITKNIVYYCGNNVFQGYFDDA